MTLSPRAPRGTADATLVFWQLAGAFVVGLATAPFGWVAPPAPDFLLLGGVAGA